MSLTDMVIMPGSHYQAICDAVRAKTGDTAVLKSGDLAAAIAGIAGGGASSEDALIARTPTSYTNTTAEEIGGYAFFNYRSLVSVDFPNVKKFTGSNNFQACERLETINFPKLELAAGGNAFSRCIALKRAVLPRLCNAGISFDGCESLEFVDMGSEVAIEEVKGIFGSFQHDQKLVTIILRYPKMITLPNVSKLSGTPIESGTGYIYVPSSLIVDYMEATNWVTFSQQFRAIEDYPEITGSAV
ncbi:MAG: leucine-rich repeat protein [Candidatus Faecousia sp.]|nr:leucine-rich repeat protein [Bacillota bacterium]MDY4219305.1 leucine-rich repeat protein [Candidatus Faecousia sp.]